MSKFSALHQSIKIRLYLQFATSLATLTIMPFIAIYFSRLVGETITGILLISVIFSGIVGGLIGGYWSDQIGRKKLLIFSELGIGISFLAIAFMNSPWLVAPYISFGLFLVNMFCSGIFYPVSTAMIYDLVKKEERNYVFTAMYWITNLAVALGSITGAFLFEDYHFYLFIFVAIISIASSIITYLFIGETFIKEEPSVSAASPSILANYLNVMKDKTYMIFLIGSLLVFSLEGHLTNYIAIHLEKTMEQTTLFGSFTINGLNMVGILQAENTLLVVFTVAIVAWLVKNRTDGWKLLFGMGIYVIGYALLSYTNSPWILIGLMVFISIGELIYVPIHQGLLAELADGSYRSSYLALDSLAGQGQMIIAGAAVTIGGFVSPGIMSGTFFLFGLIGVCMMSYVMKEISKRGTQEKTNVQ
ncbi:MFS transporter [Oceanobacillus bengalensis]|uniref:MFS transporter n=1 Tax=Oceanobacillus bengalensis TaxID=1435466 RepID=A0A494Z839_9BACI|nr:MFS transporter [Oceanobacillus bengalensis]RKQ18697.1 MFS transporter [Oceanobacillus bengalensis]